MDVLQQENVVDKMDVDEKTKKNQLALVGAPSSARDNGEESDSDFDDEPLVPKKESAANGEKDSMLIEKGKDSDSDSDSDFDDTPLVPKTEVKVEEIKISTKKTSKGTVETKVKKERKKVKQGSKKKEKVTKKVKKESVKRKRASSDEESSDSEFDDKPLVPEKKEEVKEKKVKKKTKIEIKTQEKSEEDDSLTPAERRERKRLEKLKSELPEHRYWDDKSAALPQGHNWATLEHNGPLFPPQYKPHGIKMLYDGQPIDLAPEHEELATFFATYLSTDHYQKKKFRENFFAQFKAALNKGRKSNEAHPIKEFSKCDFTPIHQHIMAEREKKKSRTKEEKEKEKLANKELQEKYGFAIIDGRREQIGNFRVEPPGLFLGRGEHPKIGYIKKRIMPEDVIINISKGAPVPEPPIPGHHWKEVIHNPTVAWLAYWKENINGSFKYVWFAPGSRVRGLSDKKKFEVARVLHTKVDKIRAKYTKNLTNSDELERQRATALYLIDKLALRVGNEKGEDEADTVGCCSLRVEHVTVREPNTLCFDFLGKDSMRYKNDVEVPEQVAKNIKKFRANKEPGDDLFDKLNASALNAHLREEMPGLTAKVFRTYNASITLERQLENTPPMNSVDEKVLFFNRANRAVAILCNHQRTLPKTFNESMERLNKKITDLEEEKSELKDYLKKVKNGSAKEKEGRNGKKLPMDAEKLKKHISKLKDRLEKLKIQQTEKLEGREFSSTTSKVNYIDPRIVVSWSKEQGVPIEKIFSRGLRTKFPWAMEEPAGYKFSEVTKEITDYVKKAVAAKAKKKEKEEKAEKEGKEKKKKSHD